MRCIKLSPALVLLAGLAACGEEQTAQTNPPPTPNATASAPPPAGTSQPSQTAQSRPATPPAGETTGAVSPTAPVPPGNYQAERLTLDLQQGGAFTLAEREGNGRVTGKYRIENGILTLSDPSGDIENATFPIRCRVARSGEGFRLEAEGDSCPLLGGTNFRPAS